MGWAQEVKVELGPDEIGINETFTIKVTYVACSCFSAWDGRRRLR